MHTRCGPFQTVDTAALQKHSISVNVDNMFDKTDGCGGLFEVLESVTPLVQGAGVPFYSDDSHLHCNSMTNFQRLESTTIGVHMRCIKISEKGKVKKWGKSTKIRNNILKNFQRLESTSIHVHIRCVKISD